MNRNLFLIIFLLSNLTVFGQLSIQKSADTILGHKVVRNEKGQMLAWYKPVVPGAAYAQVCKLASEFLLNNVPNDPKTGLPLYLVTCCFHQDDFKKIIGEEWAHNPACVYAGSVESFAIDYFSFTGDVRFIELVRGMLDYQLKFGTTPADFKWPNVPYASSNPFEKEYFGATRWEMESYRADGLHVIEPDKVGELGIAYLKFFEITGDKKYLDAAINCAKALSNNVRNLLPENSPFGMTVADKSPWPFRVNARNGFIVSEYCSNAVDPIRLFDELLRIKNSIQLDTALENSCRKARELAYKWMFSVNGPMKTFIWNAYFEDIPNDPERSNRLQITPGEMAKYLIRNPHTDIQKDVPALISWIASAFKTENLDAIKEQTWCYEPMGSHTARYGSVCAMWYEYTGDEHYKDQAFRFLNVATYMTLPNGYVAVGPNWPGAWWSDGYSDYVRHFFDAMAAIPDWAPQNENHLLRSNSIVQSIEYQPKTIKFRTFDNQGNARLRLISKPKVVKMSGKSMPWNENLIWKPMKSGGVLDIKYTGGNEIEILF